MFSGRATLMSLERAGEARPSAHLSGQAASSDEWKTTLNVLDRHSQGFLMGKFTSALQ